MNKKTLGVICTSVGMALLLAFTVVLNVLSLTKFDNIFEKFFGATQSSLQGETYGADVEYVKSDFSSASELYAYEEKKVAEIVQEGVTLLKNDGVLPLEKGKTLSIFSHSSVDLVSGGSGSGSGSFELTKDLKEGLENAGLVVNPTLWNFYKNGEGANYKRGTGVINYGWDLDWSINECPLNVLLQDQAVASSLDGTVAMFVLSRTGGEGGDEARDMAAFGGESGQHYLEPDATELEIISYLNDNFDEVILLVNCNNAIELGWVENYENVGAVVNFPGAGRTGTYGLGYALTGLDANEKEISTSGRLVDTFVYDNFSSPAMQNMGDSRFTGTNYYYVNYSEGIYVGYKYYETRYADVVEGRANVGAYDYANEVMYPFGFGLSYTQFEWSGYTMSQPNAKGEMEITVNVTNVGARAGKDVVQVYVQAPYKGNVEKSAISLVGFAKTDLLQPNQSQNVKITVDLKDFTSYDVHANNEEGGYVLDEGDYYVVAAGNAHEALNDVLRKRYAVESDSTIDLEKLVEGVKDDSIIAMNEDMVGVYTQLSYDSTTYSTAGEGLTTIKNQFTDSILSDATYLSRNNWLLMENNGLRYGVHSDAVSKAEVGGKQFQAVPTAEMKAKLESYSSLNPGEGQNEETFTYGAKNGVDLIDLRGCAFDDPLWDQLLDQITLKEVSKLIDESGYCTPEISSINKPKVNDLDGPAGLNDIIAHGSMPIGENLRAMTWPTQYMLACTWNVELAEEMGKGVAEDGLYSGTVGWYGPGMNIHRTPFTGRNFEYYSEDAFLSGILGKAEVYGAAQKGMYSFIKHFAINDQETHRDDYGLATFVEEQAIREIYLKPFEMTILNNEVEIEYNEAVKEGEEIVGYTRKKATMPAASAIMTSFNRIGTTWAGGHYNLINNVLRGEWGFNGFVLTDYEVGSGKGSYMNTLQSLAAGGDAKLKTVDMEAFLQGFNMGNHKAYQTYARDAAHHILYTVVNSAGMNGYVHGVRFVKGFAYYKIILIVWDVVAAAGLAFLSWLLIEQIKKLKMDGAGTQSTSSEITATSLESMPSESKMM